MLFLQLVDLLVERSISFSWDLSTCFDKKCLTERKNFLWEKKRCSWCFFLRGEIFLSYAWTILPSEIFRWASNFFLLFELPMRKHWLISSLDQNNWTRVLSSVNKCLNEQSSPKRKSLQSKQKTELTVEIVRCSTWIKTGENENHSLDFKNRKILIDRWRKFLLY